LNNSEGSIP